MSSFEEKWHLAVESVKKTVPYAEETGVLLVLGPLNRYSISATVNPGKGVNNESFGAQGGMEAKIWL